MTEPEFNALDDTGFIRVEDIVIGARIRPVDETWAEALGQLMEKEGQRTAIEVAPHPLLPGKWLLVTGAHRVTGAEMVGLTHLKAQVVNAAEAKTREISENLDRSALDPWERACFVGERVEILKAKAGVGPDAKAQKVAANVRWQKVVKDQAADASLMIGLAYGWADSVAEETGFSRATIYQDLLLYRRLSPRLMADLRGLPVAKNATQLRALAKMDEASREAVVMMLIDGSAKTVGEAVAMRSQKPKLSPQDKLLFAFQGAFDRMGITEKKAALGNLIGRLSPSLRDAVREELAKGDAA